MAIGRVDGVRIAGIYAGVPSTVIENLSLTEIAPAAELQKIIATIGIERRRISQVGECTSDLAQVAAEQLLADLDWPASSIELLIVVSQTGDYKLPATACVLQHRLGLSKTCAALDINLGCSGYVYGLWVASRLLSGSSSGRALLVVGDTISQTTAPADKSVKFLFGDAATVTALECQEGGTSMTFVLGTDGAGAPHLIIPGGGARNGLNATSLRREPGTDGYARSPADLFMDGAHVFNFTLREVPKLIAETLAAANWTANSVDWYVLHQANKFLLDYLGKRAKIPPERMLLALQNYGNTSSASIPLAIADKLAGELNDGELRLVLAGFGVGWSWGGAAIMIPKGTLIRVVELPASAIACTTVS